MRRSLLRAAAIALLALASAPAPADARAGTRCGYAADGFAYSIRAQGESCNRARALVNAWFDAQHRCGVSYRGAPRRRTCRVRGHRCTALRRYGMVAAVTCSAPARRVTFRYSP